MEASEDRQMAQDWGLLRARVEGAEEYSSLKSDKRFLLGFWSGIGSLLCDYLGGQSDQLLLSPFLFIHQGVFCFSFLLFSF